MSNVRKIVVIDDSKTDCEIARAALISPEFEVVVLDESSGVLGRAMKEKPDAILIDVNMEGLSGPGVVKALKRLPAGKRCALILHSHSEEEKLAALAEEAGAAGWIKKTLDSDTLQSKLKELLSKKQDLDD